MDLPGTCSPLCTTPQCATYETQLAANNAFTAIGYAGSGIYESCEP